MTSKKVDYPAKLVGYRIDVVNDRIVLFEDIPVLFNDAELERRIGTYRALEAAGAIPYTFELFSLEDLDAAKADVQADLERQLAQVRDWWQERRKREPEPVPDRWADAVLQAMSLAQAYFLEHGDRASLKRLPRAQAIAERQNWRQVGDKADTWLMPSSTGSGRVYMVNGRCSCPDPVVWCKHRIARALAKRAEAILKEDNGSRDAQVTEAPVETEGVYQPPIGTAPLNGDARRIDLTVAYRSNEAKSLAHVNANGQLIGFKADGEEVSPPVQTMPELYRWLQEHDYTPNDFKWLGWEHGLRHRRQSYTREVAA
jgi:hypothetical protein